MVTVTDVESEKGKDDCIIQGESKNRPVEILVEDKHCYVVLE